MSTATAVVPPTGFVRLFIVRFGFRQIRPPAPRWRCPAVLALCPVCSAGRQGDHDDEPDRDPDGEEDEQDDGDHYRRAAHHRMPPVSRGVTLRRPTPFSRRAPRARTSGADWVSDPRLSSLRIAIATMAMTPTMTPVPNTSPIPMAIATMMRFMTASRTSAGGAGHRRGPCLRPLEILRGPCWRANHRTTSWSCHPAYQAETNHWSGRTGMACSSMTKQLNR